LARGEEQAREHERSLRDGRGILLRLVKLADLARLILIAPAICAACGAQSSEPPKLAAVVPAQLFLFAEGPCPKLSIEAAGQRRFLVYGDHGRVLAGWLPGDRVATAETLAELRGGTVYRRASLLEGLPTDARGYVPGELRVGGSAQAPWLVRTTVRYSLIKRGPLFERTANGYRFEAGWKPTNEPVTVPEAARRLPELPVREMCESELEFVPLTWTATPKGGLIVAGRCDDEAAPSYTVTTLFVAHGAPGATGWQVRLLPAAETLNGIVNLSVAAVSDDEVYASAYQPYKEPEARRGYLARFDGTRWSEEELPIRDGIMSVASDGQGTLWLAGGRALYRLRDEQLERVALPALRFAPRGTRTHVHRVRSIDGELWVEASYQLRAPGERGSFWASALMSSRRPEQPLYCDAREPADAALYEAAP
jgi:hypothetical protein